MLYKGKPPKLVHFPNSLHNLLMLIPGLLPSQQESASKCQAQPRISSHEPATWAAASRGDSSSPPFQHTRANQAPDSPSRKEATGTAQGFQFHGQFGTNQTRSLGQVSILSDAVKLTFWLQFKTQFGSLRKNSLLLKRFTPDLTIPSLAGWPNVTQVVTHTLGVPSPPFTEMKSETKQRNQTSISEY